MYSCVLSWVYRGTNASVGSFVEELKRVQLRETTASIINNSLLSSAPFTRTLYLGLL